MPSNRWHRSKLRAIAGIAANAEQSLASTPIASNHWHGSNFEANLWSLRNI
jgi:hypothetical protein